MSPLTVYKASAGSGKTFTLAVEYISLLVKKPDAYREILAVTFTNKATAEMKMRILSQLYGIANNCEGSEAYLEAVKEKSGINDEKLIRERTSMALSMLMHNYHDFHIQTIDAFFQKVMRNLAHELDLSNSLRISLNDEDIEDHAVDEMIESLGPNSKELKWISDYINTNIDDGKGWNVFGQIKKFGRNIFKDFYKKNRKGIDEKVNDQKSFSAFTVRLKKQSDDALQKITTPAQHIIDVLNQNGLNNIAYFYYTDKSILPAIRRTANGDFNGSPTTSRMQGAIDDSKNWGKKNSKEGDRLVALVDAAGLRDVLKSMEEARLKYWRPYGSAKLTLENLTQLRLLQSIGDTVDRLNHDAGRFPLSETQMLINSLINNQDAPFIYEKIGARLRDIMIDEFQDTSTLQWENFRVLLNNCMSQEDSHSLIVGDVKQSIYRWRDGDWKLLNHFVSKDDNTLTRADGRNNGFADYQVDVKTLDRNFRSDPIIVHFNNAFFTEAAQSEADRLTSDGLQNKDVNQLKSAYSDVEQNPNKKEEKGSVRITLYPNKDYKENVLKDTIKSVQDMINKGYKPSDIAILVRANKVIPSIAKAFAEDESMKDVRLVSDEAFHLDSSMAVNTIISAMRLLLNNEDRVAKAELVKNYHQYILNDGKSASELIMSDKELDKNLPEGFIKRMLELSTMPITDLVDELIALFQLQKLSDQSAYLCSFQDILATFLQDNMPDISNFLKQWDDTLHEKTIQSDEIDGIRLISIHKSKGLEFPVVIVPFCDWQLEKSDPIWVETKGKGKPYDEIPVVPVKFSQKGMVGTVYENDYQEEHLQNIVDNLNLLYVAFTRAKDELIVIGKRKSKNSKSSESNRSVVIEKCLQNVAGTLDAHVENSDNLDEPLIFTYGANNDSIVESSDDKREEKEIDNVFEIPIKTRKIVVKSYPYPVEFKQSNDSHDFINGDDTDGQDRKRYIKLGNVMHSIFAKIHTLDDIEPQMRQLEQDGVINNEEFDTENLRDAINKALKNKQVNDWFSSHWQLYNECTILKYDKKTGKTIEHRPDRVMTDGKQWIVVDFKFGQRYDEAYCKQVREYMDLIKQMGSKNVKGYIWYVMRNEIVDVHSANNNG